MVNFGGFFAKLGYFVGFSPHIFIKTIKKLKNLKIKNKVIKLRALVAKGHKNTNAPLIFENLGYYFFLVLGKLHNGLFLGIFRGGLDFFDKSWSPRNIP